MFRFHELLEHPKYEIYLKRSDRRNAGHVLINSTGEDGTGQRMLR
jgi:hypothetical protein